MGLLFDKEAISAGLLKLVDAMRAVAQSFTDAAAAVAESIREIAARISEFPATLTNVAAQLAGLGGLWLGLANDDALTPKDLATMLNGTADKLGVASAELAGFDLPTLDSAPLMLALQEFATFVAEAPTTIRELIEPKKLFGVDTKPVVVALSKDAAVLDALIADVEAKGRSAEARVGPIRAALNRLEDSQKLDTAALSQPCDVLVAKLKDTATTLSDLPWPVMAAA